MKRLVLIATIPLCWLAAIASGEEIRFSPVPRDVIEARLRGFEDNNDKREQSLTGLFKEAGCDDTHLTEQRVKGSKLPNIICELPGTSDKTIIVGAHFDHVSQGDGVVDNWSGASLLPSLYQALKDEPRQHTYIFIGFTDEERGLVGSHFYVRSMTRDQIAAADAMVNLDTLGLAPTEFWASHTDGVLAKALAHVAGAMNLPLAAVNVDRVGTSDAEEFAARKIPRTTIHSLTQEAFDAHILHSSRDKFSAIRLDDYYQSFRLLAAFISYLDQVPRPPHPSAHR